MKIDFYFRLLLFAAFTIESCEKDCINKDSIEGNWIWTKSIGGFWGDTITPDIAGFTQHLWIDNFTFKEYRNDSLISELQYDLRVRTDSSSQTNKYIVFDSGREYEIKISKTELILYEIMWSDGYDVYYKRKK